MTCNGLAFHSCSWNGQKPRIRGLPSLFRYRFSFWVVTQEGGNAWHNQKRPAAKETMGSRLAWKPMSPMRPTYDDTLQKDWTPLLTLLPLPLPLPPQKKSLNLSPKAIAKILSITGAFTRLTISVIESSDEVASSYINIGGFFKIALAIAILCFSPPDSFKPRSPTWVWYPLGMRCTASWISAILAAS